MIRCLAYDEAVSAVANTSAFHKSVPVQVNKIYEHAAAPTLTVLHAKLKELKKLASLEKDTDKSVIGRFCKLIGSITEVDFNDPIKLGMHVKNMNTDFKTPTSRKKTLQTS